MLLACPEAWAAAAQRSRVHARHHHSAPERNSMEAIVYSGPRNVEVKQVPDPENHRDEGGTKVVLNAAA
jgi:hypothetical protein